MNRKMLLIDGHGLAFRGFYALPETLAASDGTPTNAIVGFTNMLMKCLDGENLDALGMFFDPKGPTKRHEMFKEYKEGRKPAPDAFKAQMPLIIDICRAMGVPVFIRDGIEADDYIIATALHSADAGWNVNILTADKDLFQIIRDGISVLRPSRGVSEFTTYDKSRFVSEYGFQPELMSDYLALLGDSVDNIPGVPGIGEKGAKELVAKFGDLESIYAHINDIAKGKRAKLEESRELAFMSRELIVPQHTENVPEESLHMSEPNYAMLENMCQRLGLRRLSEHFKHEDAKTVCGAASNSGQAAVIANEHGPLYDEVPLAELLKSKELAIVRDAEKEDSACYIFADRHNGTAALDLANKEETARFAEWCKSGTLYVFGLRNLMLNDALPMPDLRMINDVEIVHYLLHPDRGGNISKTIGRPLPSGAELARDLFALWNDFAVKVKELDMEHLLNDIDRPLSPVLAKLQRDGFRVDGEKLAALKAELIERISQTEKKIYSRTYEKINLNSPKQVSWLLFDTLKLPPIKKTSSGFSTDASVLEELARLPAPMCDVPHLLIEYREESKMLSAFVEPFLKLSETGDGKIHSTFDQLATGTGRLASSDPNVQNMPAFGELAEKFRSCFVPARGNIYISADYSQIELRVLAHLSGEKKLLDAFIEHRDIHTETASWVFGQPAEDISPEQRRFAKVVNFGLLYGMSAHGLAQRLGVTRSQAASMVDRYFSVLPSVREYMSQSVKDAKERGCTRSIFGRIRPLSELSTIEGRGNNPIDRVALNTPIQSAASDIAKIALLRFSDVIKREFSGAGIILQIHDSIVCECREEDADDAEQALVKTMEGVNVLSVPVKVESKRGYSMASV